jgi:hypothetical protein
MSLCFHIPRTPLISLRAIFSVSTTEKKAKRTATWEYRGYSSGCDDVAHRHSGRDIHQLLSGLAETLATVYWLGRELLRREQETLVVRLNFVFFTDSFSELYGQIWSLIKNIFCLYIHSIPKYWRTAVAQWLRCWATNWKVAGSIPAGVIGIFHWHNPSDHTMALGSTQPPTEMSTRSIPGGKGGRA